MVVHRSKRLERLALLTNFCWLKIDNRRFVWRRKATGHIVTWQLP